MPEVFEGLAPRDLTELLRGAHDRDRRRYELAAWTIVTLVNAMTSRLAALARADGQPIEALKIEDLLGLYWNDPPDDSE
jgi:hypothetical protein